MTNNVKMDSADSFTKNANVACHTQPSGSEFHHDEQPTVTENDAEKLQKMSLTTFLAVFVSVSVAQALLGTIADVVPVSWFIRHLPSLAWLRRGGSCHYIDWD